MDHAAAGTIELAEAVRLYPGARTLEGGLMLRPSLDGAGDNGAVFGI